MRVLLEDTSRAFVAFMAVLGSIMFTPVFSDSARRWRRCVVHVRRRLAI